VASPDCRNMGRTLGKVEMVNEVYAATELMCRRGAIQLSFLSLTFFEGGAIYRLCGSNGRK